MLCVLSIETGSEFTSVAVFCVTDLYYISLLHPSERKQKLQPNISVGLKRANSGDCWGLSNHSRILAVLEVGQESCQHPSDNGTLWPWALSQALPYSPQNVALTSRGGQGSHLDCNNMYWPLYEEGSDNLWKTQAVSFSRFRGDWNLVASETGTFCALS